VNKIIQIIRAEELPYKTRLTHSVYNGLVEVELTKKETWELTRITPLTIPPSQMMYEDFKALREKQDGK